MPDLPSIDLQAIENLRELNPGDNGEFLREIIGIYLEDTPVRIADLKACFSKGDTAAFTRAAHTIKGSSSNVGAQSLRSIAERLEFTSRKEGLAQIGPLIEACEAEFARASAELRKITS